MTRTRCHVATRRQRQNFEIDTLQTNGPEMYKKNNQVQNETEMETEFRSKQTDKQAAQYFIKTGFL